MLRTSAWRFGIYFALAVAVWTPLLVGISAVVGDLTGRALPEVLAVAGNEARNGAYYGPTRVGDSRGPVGDSTISDAAKDAEAGARLWTLSEELLGITWDIGPH